MDPDDLIDPSCLDLCNEPCDRPHWLWKLILAFWIFS